MEVDDLAAVTHDPLLASLRQRLRKRTRRRAPGPHRRALRVLARERGRAGRSLRADAGSDGTLNCHGYGSSVTVTATFGMVAAGEAIAQLLAPPGRRGP